MKLNLINPAMSPLPKHELIALPYDVPSSGLMRLASYAKQEIKGLEVNVYNEFSGLPEHIYDADFVGVSSTIASHPLSIYHLRKAKSHGAVTLIGGPNVGPLRQQIAKNHEAIDYVVVGKGEKSLVEILKGEAKQKILNNPIDIRELPFWDLSYFRNSYNTNSKIPIANIEGCFKAEKSGKCSYCSTPNIKTTMRSPEQFWEQITKLHDEHGLTYFFETGDSFPVRGEYLERLVRSKPENLENIKLHIYLEPASISDANIENLKKIGVASAFVGIESFNENILRRIPKKHDPKKIVSELGKLNSNGIEIFAGLIYALPGEDKKSLDNNLEGVKRLLDETATIPSLLSCFIPIPGSRIYQQITHTKNVVDEYNSFGRNLIKEDQIDYSGLFLSYMPEFCPDLKPSELFRSIDLTRNMIGEGYNEFTPIEWGIREKLGI